MRQLLFLKIYQLSKHSAMLFVGVIVFGLLTTHTGRAETIPRNFNFATENLTFTADDLKFIASTETVNSWKKYTELPSQKNVELKTPNITNLIASSFGQDPEQEISHYNYDPALVYGFVKTFSSSINQPSIEPALTIENNKATFFTAPQDGRTIDLYDTVFKTISALENLSTTVPISLITQNPLTPLSKTNNLGISELLSRGQSSFKGSPYNRRWNIKVGVQKMTGVIVAPGDTFSFNKYLGPVEDGYGFLPELVIKKTGTVPELGGGLCQVSSTTFRAAMQAGLPIVERRNHAYAVSYYSPQGTDATIYPGIVDLKFTNDTEGHILIWPHFKDENTLFFDFYGTKDDRQVNLKKPMQFDRKPDGSMKAVWERQVIKNGNTTNDTFKSTYQPPALFHKTESFVTSSSSPQNSIINNFKTSTPAP